MKNSSSRYLTLVTFLLCFITASFSQQEVRTIHIRKTSEKIVIDGDLKENTWTDCERSSSFCQNFPYDTSLAVTKTEVMLSYDEDYLYVAAICYDSLDGKYVIQSLKRDFSYPVSDAFVVTIDPFSDKQNGFSFGVNPYGVQREGLVAGGGGQGVTTNWDNKWFSEVKRYKNLWTVEMAIPFKTLRYKSNLEEWGINFSRNDLKRNENSSWVKVPRQFNISTLAFTGKLIWDDPPKKPSRNISIIPYAIGKVSRDFIAKSPVKYEGNIGGDAKISLSSSLNLDLTVNPDFAQVEVDRQVTNLTRFSLFFPEQRQFFIENSDLFANFGFRQIRPFFSRNVGLNNGNVIPILGGARLSGKPNKNWRIGVMDVQTAKTTINNKDIFAQNYFVAAAQRNVFSRSNVAFIFVNRQQFDTTGYSISQFNRVVGLDYNLASANNRWNGKFFFHHSLSNKNNEDAYAHASWLYYSTPKVQIMWNHEYVNKKYNAESGFTPRIFQTNNLTGFVTRYTYWRFEPKFNYYFYPKNSVINKMGPEIYVDHYRNEKFQNTDLLLQGAYDIYFTNTSGIFVDYQNIYTKLIYPTDVTFSGNSKLLDTGNYYYQNLNLKLKSNERKVINGSVSGNYGTYFTGTKLSLIGELNFRMQPFAILGITYTHDEIMMPYIGKKVSLELISPRVEISFTRSIFFTTFMQYNSQIKNVNINCRFQWRFKPMSDLYIVYSDNYMSDNFSEKNRGLVIKLVYWLGI